MIVKKDSQHFVEAPLPPLPAEFQSMTLGHEKHAKRLSTKEADTTMIFFDNPVWDDAKFRQELLDSDDEKYSIGDAPYIMEDEDTLDNILRETHHEADTNPIQHYHADESILSSDDEHDYSTLDLRKPTNGSFRQPKSAISRVRSPDAKYEKSILDL
uniref:AGC-kinase C-terminal domain-containing protein n=2 Tax=Caenorhabditis tropicalis TaxID=1561998 RepID=A0A1I7T5R6_9PELO